MRLCGLASGALALAAPTEAAPGAARAAAGSAAVASAAARRAARAAIAVAALAGDGDQRGAPDGQTVVVGVPPEWTNVPWLRFVRSFEFNDCFAAVTTEARL